MQRTFLIACLLIGCFASACSPVAAAQSEVCVLQRAASSKETKLSLSPEFVERHFPFPKERLRRGLSAVLIHKVDIAFDGSKDGPGGDSASASKLAPIFFGCKIVYDLWEEHYVITAIDSDRHPQGKVVRLVAPLVNWPSECFGFSWQGLQALPQSIRVATEYNPSTPEQIERTKKWLASKGVGSSSGTGSFVGRAAVAIVRLSAQPAIERTCDLDVK